MISVVSGTFNILHDGHKKLIFKAFELGDRVLVGITGDDMAASNRNEVIPLPIRKKELIRFLSTMDKPWEILEINDIYGPKERIDEGEILVVSKETLPNAEKVNTDRISRGVNPMTIHVVPLVNYTNDRKISSSDIIRGDYSKHGNPDAIKIAVGSVNTIKVEAVRAVMERVFEDVIIIPVKTDTGVPEQPREEETRQGAVNRAKNAIDGYDMGVGIEAGVFETEDGLYDFQYCAIIDKEGYMTIGIGPGFKYPDDVAELVSKGKTVGEAVHILFGKEDVGKKQGAVGLLSKGLLDRETLTEQSVTAAMIPRMRKM